jgi:hypothetical protein
MVDDSTTYRDMSSGSIAYIEAKVRVNRAIKRITGFIQASVDFNQDRSNVAKRAKVS